MQLSVIQFTIKLFHTVYASSHITVVERSIFITLLHVSTLSCYPQYSLQSIPCQVTPVFQMQLSVIRFTIKLFHTVYASSHIKVVERSIIITLLHVSTLSCHPQYSLQSIPCQVTPVFQMQLSVIQFTIKLFHTVYASSHITVVERSIFITLLHVSTMLCHPQYSLQSLPCQVTPVFQMQLLWVFCF
jgi:hypothetical protein